jgi:hypothetical protein
MKVSELIQSLLDIQHLAGEDVEIKPVIFSGAYDLEFKKSEILLPVLMHQPESMEQVCVFGLSEDTKVIPEKDNHYLIQALDDSWQYGECEKKWLGVVEFMHSEA